MTGQENFFLLLSLDLSNPTKVGGRGMREGGKFRQSIFQMSWKMVGENGFQEDSRIYIES